MKRIRTSILALAAAASLAAGVSAQAVNARGAEIPGTAGYDPADIVESLVFAHIAAIDLGAKTIAVDGAPPAPLGSPAPVSAAGLTVGMNAYGIAITAKTQELIQYRLSGAMAGTVTVASDAPYGILLDGAEIAAERGPALNLQSKKKAYIVLADGKANVLSDTKVRAKELDEKGALSGKGAIVISGNGSLSVTGNYKHAVYAKEYVRVRGGSLNVAVTARDGIRCDQGFYFDGGELSIVGTGSAIDEESKGIKVDGTESAPGKGSIVINGGRITIKTVGKGITAAWEAAEDATTADTADDPNPDVTINGGVITVTTSAVPYEKKTADGKTVSCSPEGIEAKSDLVVNGGTLALNTPDDCLNAGSSITINGGSIYARSTANDAIDSNGTMKITGGLVMAIGTGGPEGAFDCDMNEFAVTGGTLIGFGGSTSGPTAAACSQPVLIAGKYAAGDTVAIKDASGATVVSFKVPAALPTLVVSAPGFKRGGTYTVWTGVAISGGTEFYGLASGGAASGGTLAATFTLDDIVTKIGGMIFMMGPGGPGGPGMPPPEGFGPPPEGWEPPEGWTPPDGWTPPQP